MRGRALWAALVVGIWSVVAQAEIVVNAPQPITRRVKVQLIQTALDTGASPATVFGNATQRADIEAAIDEIWAQAGIDVAFLPAIHRYNDTFAYQGNDGTATRDSDDFNAIFNNARNEGGILHADSLVLNLILVNVVPAFWPLGQNSAAGYARVRGNGIIGYVGSNLLTWDDGRDVISSVMAHEIGHNLGLNHTSNGQPNLMSPSGTSEQLNASQISTARSSSFAREIALQLAGDYNGDGAIDAADYTIWRNTLGQVGSGLAADGNGNGRIDSGDYIVWKTNYGIDSGATGASGDFSVPEPSGTAIAISFMVVMTFRRSREWLFERSATRGRSIGWLTAANRPCR
jgi:hypothetical protein